MSERSSDTTTRYCGTVGGDDEERRRWRRVLLVTGASSWINTATFSTINVGLPDIAKSFPGHSLSAMGWVITTYAIVFGAFLLPAGRIADRFATYAQWY